MADRYQNALMWCFDRLSLDGGMTVQEQKYTMMEIGKVLSGLPSPAARYQPTEWSPSRGIAESSDG